MKPTEILSSEHRVIEQVLGCLEKIIEQARQNGRLERQPAEDAIAFFRNFADRCHHGKEEAHLFPALEAQGFPRQGGPTGVMLHEHIDKEDHVLFVLADRVLTADDQQQLLDAFTKVEAEEMGAGTHAAYLRIADELAGRFGVLHAATSHGGHGACGCGH
jgi:hemerythrin-like domain-containing protein